MSWYLFQSSPAVKQRGIKVSDFQDLHRPKINLSWGMNEKQSSPRAPQYGDILPATIANNQSGYEAQQSHNINNMRVLTDTSEDEQQELMKLIKKQNEKKMQQQIIQLYNRNKSKSQSNSVNTGQYLRGSNKQESQKSPIDRKIRYLQNSLLPSCRRDSMAIIFDHDLNKDIPIDESRVSGKSVMHNKKNQSTVVFGNGFNHFTSVQQPQKDYLQKLQEMYDYQQRCKKRKQQGNIKFG